MRWREASVELLGSQAVYLLEQSEGGGRRDEWLNLRRVMLLLARLAPGQTGDPTESKVVCEVRAYPRGATGVVPADTDLES
jgi:hypothetical protein